MKNNLYSSSNIHNKMFDLSVDTKLFVFLIDFLFLLFNNNIILEIIFIILNLLLLKSFTVKKIKYFHYLKNIWYLELLFVLICFLTVDIYKGVYIFLSLEYLLLFDYYIFYTSSFIELKNSFNKILKILKRTKINYLKISELLVNVIVFLPKISNVNTKVTYKQKIKGKDTSFIEKIILCIKEFKNIEIKKNNISKLMYYEVGKDYKIKSKQIGLYDIILTFLQIIFICILIFKEVYHG